MFSISLSPDKMERCVDAHVVNKILHVKANATASTCKTLGKRGTYCHSDEYRDLKLALKFKIQANKTASELKLHLIQ